MPDELKPYKLPWEVPKENPGFPVPEPFKQPNNPINQNIQPSQRSVFQIIIAFVLPFGAVILSFIFFMWLALAIGAYEEDKNPGLYTLPMAIGMTMLIVGPIIVGAIVMVFIMRKYISKSSKPNKIFLTLTLTTLFFLLFLLSRLILKK